MEHTNYYFDVNPDHLEEALDRFSQFFISPLFTEDASDRELNAVHNEHMKNIQSDIWREIQFLRSKSNLTSRSQFAFFVTPEIIESASDGTEEIKKKFRQRRR